MGVIYAKQPNGRYLEYSKITDRITDYDLTEYDLVKRLGEYDARRIIDSKPNTGDRLMHLWPLSYIKKSVQPDYCSLDQVRSILNKIGDPDWNKFKFNKSK